MNIMKWNENDVLIAINLIKRGESYKEIGTILNRTSNSIRNKLNEFGLSVNTFKKIEKKFCLACDDEIKKFGIKFCSQKCAATHNNKLRKKNIFKKCLNCGNKINRKLKFCNNKCQGSYKVKMTIKQIENGCTTLHSDTYKRYLIKKYGEKCMECGWNKINPTTNKIPIQMEHIDGNSENNSVDNLKLLCPNCHSLTSTFGALNKGNGREKRRLLRNTKKIKLGV